MRNVSCNFPAKNETWRQLVGNGLSYVIPRFQRDYSWTQDEWDDLWQDFLGTIKPGGEPAHYMGYLVLQTRDNKTFEVIDGQQRLTTLSIIALAVLKALRDLVDENVDASDNQKRIDQLRSSFVGYLDPVTLIPRNKLTLNRNNDAYYRDYIVPLQRLPQRRLRKSEHALRRAFEWFNRQVKDEFGQARNGAILAKFIDDLSDRLFFTVITVTDELNAFKVFETLNSRGVRLSPTDLLKNYLFSVVHRAKPHEGEIETLERRWDQMVGKLGGEDFPGFLRTHWNSRRKFVREAELFKTIRAETGSKALVFDLIRQKEEDLDVYSAFQDPDDLIWSGDQKRYIRELRMFNVRQPRPLLLAAHRAYDAGGFTEVLRACSVITFRYNVIGGLGAAEQERVYNSVAQRIASKELAKPGDAVRALAPIYVSDDSFRGAFAEKVLMTTAPRNKTVVRYILLQLEKHMTQIEHDPGSPQITLEHVLPENPGTNWSQFDDEETDDLTYRLGNLSLMPAAPNREIGNAGFDGKLRGYSTSDFLLTRKIAENNVEWTAERIAERQKWMANQATAIWRIAQFG